MTAHFPGRLDVRRQAQCRLTLVCIPIAALVALWPISGQAIEMFTFFGDGSRIGLPSLEVPVEAYPGIPLRSDRIRMRTGRFSRWRAVRQQPIAQPIPEARGTASPAAGGIRIRPMEGESKEWPIAPSPDD